MNEIPSTPFRQETDVERDNVGLHDKPFSLLINFKSWDYQVGEREEFEPLTFSLVAMCKTLHRFVTMYGKWQPVMGTDN